MKRITIIGSGFGAISAIKTIRKNDKACEITVVSDKEEFVYLPSLIWIPTKLRKPTDLIVSLDPFFKKNNVKLLKGLVSSVSEDCRKVIIGAAEVENDALIIASGARFIKAAKGIEHTQTLCEGIASAQAISDKIDSIDGGIISFGFAGNPKEITALRGGPIFELMLGVETYLRKSGRRDKFKLKFFSPAPKPGIRLGEKAYNGLIQTIEKRGIEIASLGAKIVEFRENEVETENCTFASDLTIFMPGLTGPKWLENTKLPLSEGGMIKTDEFCRVVGLKNTYAVGDCASFNSPDWAPKQGHMADLQGIAAAKNCLSDLNGESGQHRFEWELVCIVDTVDGGTMVYRTEKTSIVLSSPLFHLAKRIFETIYINSIK